MNQDIPSRQAPRISSAPLCLRKTERSRNKRVFQILKGDLLFSNVFAWEGAVAVASAGDDGLIGSHRFIACVAAPGIVVSDFLRFHFLTPRGLEDLGAASPGGAGRNRTLGLEKLETLKVPVPHHSVQLAFCSLM